MSTFDIRSAQGGQQRPFGIAYEFLILFVCILPVSHHSMVFLILQQILLFDNAQCITLFCPASNLYGTLIGNITEQIPIEAVFVSVIMDGYRRQTLLLFVMQRSKATLIAHTYRGIKTSSFARSVDEAYAEWSRLSCSFAHNLKASIVRNM